MVLPEHQSSGLTYSVRFPALGPVLIFQDFHGFLQCIPVTTTIVSYKQGYGHLPPRVSKFIIDNHFSIQRHKPLTYADHLSDKTEQSLINDNTIKLTNGHKGRSWKEMGVAYD